MSLPYAARPSSGYLPSSTGSIHQALFHWLRLPTANIAARAASMSSGLSLAGCGDLRRDHVADLAPASLARARSACTALPCARIALCAAVR